MKKTFKSLSVSLVLIFSIFGCELYSPDVFEGDAIVHFLSNGRNYTVQPGDTQGITIPVGITVAANFDRQFAVVVDNTAPIPEGQERAIEGVHFQIPVKTVTIPAGQVLGQVQLLGLVDGFDENPVVAVIRLEEGIPTFRRTFSITMNRLCPSDLAGNWLANSVFTSPSGQLNNYAVTITENGENGVYRLSDITGGLYAVGYGTGRDNPVTLVDVCGRLTVTDQPDVVYGGDVFNASGTVNADGTLTLTWSNGFGDAGSTVFRRP